MDFQSYIRALRRSWTWVLGLTLIGIAAGGGLALVQTPAYESTARLFVTAGKSQTTNEHVQGATFAQSLVNSYSILVDSEIVLAPVIAELQLKATVPALANRVSAASPAGTAILEVTASDPDPEKARTIADAVSRSLVQAVDKLMPGATDGATVVALTPVDPARIAGEPASPNLRMYFGAGAAAGLVLGLALALILDARARPSGRRARSEDPA